MVVIDLLEKLIDTIKKYNKDADTDIVVNAYNYANKKHEGQYRRSGEAYIMHPIEVALILANLQLDVATIAAGLMHDVVEDTDTTYSQMVELFGEEIATLVEGVTKLTNLNYENKEKNHTENLRKMFMAMAKDIRVVLIKLADRLHNARTFKYMPPSKAYTKSKETLEIFAPIAGRLGISKIQWEMEDISIRYLEPEFYFDLERRIDKKIKQRDEYINQIMKILKEKIDESGINCEITGREKHIYSIYKKMTRKHKDFEEIYDLMAVRVIVDSVKDCYGVLGIVHTIWKPLPKRFKDYIASPKTNMYQSLHTTILGPDGSPVEIQIRTWDMHRTAEYGIAAHWKYKEGRIDQNETETDKKMAWLRQIMDWQQDVSDPEEFMDSLKIELFSNQVFVFTPKGDVIDLPSGSTPIDLAYKIHTKVGDNCVGAKVGGKMIPLNTILNNGDIVEIITSQNSKGPSRDWLNIVKSSHARSKIRNWFKKERREENIEKGRELLEREVKRQAYPVDEFFNTKAIQKTARFLSLQTEEDLYSAIGYGGITINQAMSRLKQIYEKEHAAELRERRLKKLQENRENAQKVNKSKNSKNKKNSQAVQVKGVDNILTRFAKCCTPIPGDEIIGFITKGRGVSIHRKDCANIVEQMQTDKEKIVEVQWNESLAEKTSFNAELQINAYDRSGLLADISRIFEDEKVPLLNVNARMPRKSISVMTVAFEIQSIEQLKKIINRLKQVKDVVEVFRIVN